MARQQRPWARSRTSGSRAPMAHPSRAGSSNHPTLTPDSRYPLILSIHGGPHVMWSRHEPTMWHEWQVLAARGYVVFACNPRGSDGYGQDFRAASAQPLGRGRPARPAGRRRAGHCPRLCRPRAGGDHGRVLWGLYDRLGHRPRRSIQGRRGSAGCIRPHRLLQHQRHSQAHRMGIRLRRPGRIPNCCGSTRPWPM